MELGGRGHVFVPVAQRQETRPQPGPSPPGVWGWSPGSPAVRPEWRKTGPGDQKPVFEENDGFRRGLGATGSVLGTRAMARACGTGLKKTTRGTQNRPLIFGWSVHDTDPERVFRVFQSVPICSTHPGGTGRRGGSVRICPCGTSLYPYHVERGKPGRNRRCIRRVANEIKNLGRGSGPLPRPRLGGTGSGRAPCAAVVLRRKRVSGAGRVRYNPAC
jgi:hypothetical protein